MGGAPSRRGGTHGRDPQHARPHPAARDPAARRDHKPPAGRRVRLRLRLRMRMPVGRALPVRLTAPDGTPPPRRNTTTKGPGSTLRRGPFMFLTAVSDRRFRRCVSDRRRARPGSSAVEAGRWGGTPPAPPDHMAHQEHRPGHEEHQPPDAPPHRKATARGRPSGPHEAEHHPPRTVDQSPLVIPRHPLFPHPQEHPRPRVPPPGPVTPRSGPVRHEPLIT